MRILVLGMGRIGQTVKYYLKERFPMRGLVVDSADSIESAESTRIDFNDIVKLEELIHNYDVVIATVPYQYLKSIASICAKYNIAYFDPTEDRETTEFIKTLKSTNVLVPQCGLAPGAVSVISMQLIRQFEKVDSLDIRVGALPLLPNNQMKYNLTWSTEGLINEYCNMCDSLHDGKRTNVMPLDGYETLILESQQYEAFNTSGGNAGLCEVLENQVDSLTYKSIRYVGHHQCIKFLMDDLNLRKNKDLFVKLFDQEIPRTSNDVVLIMIKVTGMINSILTERNYFVKIFGQSGFSAIQIATAMGILAALDAIINCHKTHAGYLRQEEINYDGFVKNFGQIFVV